jgi:hypothetical protein
MEDIFDDSLMRISPWILKHARTQQMIDNVLTVLSINSRNDEDREVLANLQTSISRQRQKNTLKFGGVRA